jgi:protein O-GlcNAc transferase
MTNSRNQLPALTQDQSLQQAVTQHKAGQLQDAERLYRAILKTQPKHPDANYNLGMLAVQVKQPAAGLPHLKAALEANPSQRQYWLSYIEALIQTGRTDVARKVLMQGRRRGLQGEAVDALAERLEGPSSDEINTLLTLFKLGLYTEGETRAKELTLRFPQHGFGWKALGAMITAQKRSVEALEPLQKAAKLLPEDAETHNNLGCARKDQGQYTKAEANYRRALEIKPDFAEVHSNLGAILREQGRLTEAEASCRKAIEIKPDYAEAHSNLGATLKDQGRLREAETSCRQALEIRPDYAEAHSNLLFILAHNGVTSAEDYLAQARDWDLAATTTEERRNAGETTFHPLPRHGRRLKIGYVSGDFRQHPVRYFIEKLFCGHNRERYEIFAYSKCPKTDDATKSLRKMVDHWTQLVDLTDAKAKEHIRQDGIDVLIDLSGHTAYNGLKIFANRSAPVQAHYLGFFASTGLAEMDYWIGDAILIPKSDAGHYSERIWRLPRVWINYHAGDAAPAPAWRPDPSGHLWFGSFNNLYKITTESVALWSRILRSCPQGRLLLKTAQFVDSLTRENLMKAFVAQGVPSERISLIGRVPDWREHMALYDRLDVVLDPVGGVCGGTTTCDALWMGVPVITMAGAGMARRMSASMLTSLGRTEWIAQSADAYVEKAISLAQDVDTRCDLRLRQRDDMTRSPLCDSQGLVQALEDAYEKMFELWQEKKR